MVMVSPKMNPTICCLFEAAIVLLFHAKTFRRGSQVTVHVGNVRQTATAESLDGKVLSLSCSVHMPAFWLDMGNTADNRKILD